MRCTGCAALSEPSARAFARISRTQCPHRYRRRRMKFCLNSSIANPSRSEHLDRCVDQVIAEAQLAEASGFDACFFGEHHQDKDGFLPSPLIVATAVAAQTRRLYVGT